MPETTKCIPIPLTKLIILCSSWSYNFHQNHNNGREDEALRAKSFVERKSFNIIPHHTHIRSLDECMYNCLWTINKTSHQKHASKTFCLLLHTTYTVKGPLYSRLCVCHLSSGYIKKSSRYFVGYILATVLVLLSCLKLISYVIGLLEQV